MSQIRVLLIKESGTNWVAQCLEHDITAQGSTIKKALDAFDTVLMAELAYCAENNLSPMAGIKPAPTYYWRLFDEAAEMKTPRRVPLMPLIEGMVPDFMMPSLSELRAA